RGRSRSKRPVVNVVLLSKKIPTSLKVEKLRVIFYSEIKRKQMNNLKNKVYYSLQGAINVITKHIAGCIYIYFLLSTSIKGENEKRRTAGALHRFHNREKREVKPR